MWKDNNKSIIYNKEYYIKNRDKIIKNNKLWKKKDYKKNPKKYKDRNKKYRLKNIEYYNKYRREWRYKRPEGIWEVLKQGAIKRKKLLNIKREDFILWWNKQQQICFYCGVSINKLKELKDSTSSWCNRLTIDRIDNKKPYQIDNIVLACRRCNMIKGDFFTYEEMKEIGEKYVKPKRI